MRINNTGGLYLSNNTSAALAIVQNKLKAPKGQENKFGGYKYRSCEDIMESVKPILSEIGAVLTVSDELCMIGERYYVKATASFFAIGDRENAISTTAYARECATKKGMDDSQITGSTSSYARKMSLSGLFCLDDTKDADTQAPTRQRSKNAESDVDPKLKSARQSVVNLAKEMMSKGIAKEAIYQTIAKNNNGKRMPSSIPTIEDCNRIMSILSNMKDD